MQFQKIIRFLLIAIAAALATNYAISARATDWETAALVAWCPNRPGFEKDARRIVAILHEHSVRGDIMYYENVQGVNGLTEDIEHSTGWMLAVNVKDADAARKLIAEATKKGLRVNLLPEGSKLP